MTKTIRVADLIAKVNARNANSTCSAEVREGWNDLLAEVLQDTGNYVGFGYLREVPAGQQPGITGDCDLNYTFPDSSRRRYYTPVYLQPRFKVQA